MSTPFRLFALGLTLGATTTWLFHSSSPGTPSPGSASASAELPSPRSPLPALAPWSWRDSDTPPPLPAASVAPAIAAWLAQRGPDGAPADFATRAATLRALLVRLPASGFPDLVEALSRSTRDEDLPLRREAFDAWAALDAPAATRWAVGQDPRSLDLARDAARLWAAQDAAAAATWVCALADKNVAARLAAPILAALAEKDPARALALARSRDESFRISALAGIIETLGRADPAGTVRTYGPDVWRGGGGLHMLSDPLTAWVKQDPASALAWLVAQPRDPHRASNAFDWINTVGNRTPEWRRTVADAFLNGPDKTHRAAGVATILGEWNREHPEEALAWLDSIEDRDLRLTLLERVAGTHGGAPAKTLPLVLALPEGSTRTMHLTQILADWAKTDAPAALAWIQANDVPGVATAGYAVQGTLLAGIASEEPRTALAEWNALQDPKARAATFGAIVNAWGLKDPVAALRWADEQSLALGTPAYPRSDIFSIWARTEPEAALRWIETWISRHKDVADVMARQYLSALGGTWEDKAPRAATADLYSKIQDPGLRVETLTRHIREWQTKDPAAAKAWLDSQTALTPAQTAALLAR